MKALPAAVLSAVVAALITFAVTTQRQPELPPVEFVTGFSFNVPCMEHGTHTQTVSGNRLVRAYEISQEGEVLGEATAEQLAEVLEMVKAMGVPQPETNGTQESR